MALLRHGANAHMDKPNLNPELKSLLIYNKKAKMPLKIILIYLSMPIML